MQGLLTALDIQCQRGCGATDGYIEKHGAQTGVYCSECKKWIKWLNKDDTTIAMNILNDAANGFVRQEFGGSKPEQMGMQSQQSALRSRSRATSGVNDMELSMKEAYDLTQELIRKNVLDSRYNRAIETLLGYVESNEGL